MDKVKKLTEQLTDAEQEELALYIERHYAVSFEESVVRDDIRDKILEMLKLDFEWVEEIQEEDSFAKIMMSASEVSEFCKTVEDEFELDIEFASVMEWQKVKDMVDYIECALEDKSE